MLREVREIPGTLNGLYLWLCQRLFVRKQFAKIQPILNLLLAASRPLCADVIYACLLTRFPTLTLEEFERRLKLMSKISWTGGAGRRSSSTTASPSAAGREALHAEVPVRHGGRPRDAGHARHGPGRRVGRCAGAGAGAPPDSRRPAAAARAPPPRAVCSCSPGPAWRTALLPGLPKDSKVLKLLLDAGAVMPTLDISTESLAAEEERAEEAKVKEEAELPVDQVDANGRTLLHTASHQGKMSLVSSLLGRGADVKAVDKTGQTALNLAARQGHSEVVGVLVKSGAEVDHADQDGWTALRSAAWGGHNEVVSVLLLLGPR